MIRSRRLIAALAASCALFLAAACGGGGGAARGAAAGEPTAGGSARILTLAEPRSLDPATLGNSGPITAVVGNALFGTLMLDDPATGEITFSMAESFTTTNGGQTFELKLRPGLVFSDRTPLTAEDVKFNWEHTKDAATGSSSRYEASQIASSEVVDDRTLKLTMVTPLANFASMIVTTTLNWVGKPEAIQAGQQAFDAAPIGAGPFTMRNWTRNGPMELVKNPRYWDSPRPYLDSLTLRAATDATQRYNTVVSGGADVAVDTNWTNLAKARTSGLVATDSPLSGGLYLALNARRAPFDDVRARQAVSAAIDEQAINASVYSGKAEAADTLFQKTSPFYDATPLRTFDKAKAQQLFDELAAEGKPVTFTITSYPSSESRGIAESIQAQLSAFKNVQVQIKIVDISYSATLRTTYDFDMVPTSAFFVDPDPRLWTVLHSKSQQNLSGITDPALDTALQAGRATTDVAQRKKAYATVQQRITELAPVIFVERTANGAISADGVGGVRLYGNGSLSVAELWKSNGS